MILVDTSVWIDHLGRGDSTMTALLEGKRVLMHPFVLGEIAMGSLRQRSLTLLRLNAMPKIRAADAHEVLRLIDSHPLSGRGIGYVDAHLLAATLLTPGTRLWTRDRRLQGIAEELGVAA